MRIGELAKRSGVSVQALRFYEREGVLSDPVRSESGYRIYGPDQIKRLTFIKQAKALGLSLAEIRRILQLRDKRHMPCTEVVAIAKQHIAQVEVEMRRLRAYRSKLARTLALWKAGKQCASADAICSLIESAVKVKTKA